MRRTLNLARVAIALGAITGAIATAHAQTMAAPAIPLHAEIKPGETLRYELEASASFLPQVDTVATITNPRGPCDYSLSAIVTLNPKPSDKDGNTPVEATYSEGRVTSVRCAPLNNAWFERRLKALEQTPFTFRIGPHGETAFLPNRSRYFDYWNGADLLRKVTRDLLQTEFSSLAVARGAVWKPRGQFAYGKENGLRDLELSGAEMRFRSLVDINHESCAWITSKYVFSPLDVAASATTTGGVRVATSTGNNAVAAVLEVSLLLDRSSHHIAWLRRSQTIDNRLTVGSPLDPADDPSADPVSSPMPEEPIADDPSPDDQGDDPGSDRPVPPASPMPDLSGMRQENPAHYPYMTFHFEQEARARLLPQQDGMEWLAALRRFEQSPEGETKTTTAAEKPAKPGIAEAAKPATLQKTRITVDSDTLLTTPAGFTRYEKGLCSDAWFCAAVSVALPGDVQISEETPLRAVYLAKKGDLVVSVAVGPALDPEHPGLTEDEALKKAANHYLANYVWLAEKPGIGTSFSSATLDGYPALVANFHATQHDLADLQGVLGVALTPWGKIIPVSCQSDGARSAELQALCDKIITSISVRR